jgi:hypothetical protein
MSGPPERDQLPKDSGANVRGARSASVDSAERGITRRESRDVHSTQALSLQKSAGNRAVATLLRAGTQHPVQRFWPDLGAAATPGASAAAPQGTRVGKYARVGKVDPFLSVRTNMDHRPVSSASDPLLAAALNFDDRLFVIEEYPQDWAKVRTDDGTIGYTWLSKLFVGAPDPQAHLRKIEVNDTALGIAMDEYHCGEWGRDGRFFVNVLVSVNQASGDPAVKKGIYKAGGSDDASISSWKDAHLLADYWIWVPGEEFARSLAGTVSSGSISYELWQSLKGLVGFVVGVLDGIATTLVDLVMDLVGLAAMVVDLVIDIARKGVSAKLRELQEFFDKLDVEEIASAIWNDFVRRWNAADSWDKWKFRGLVTGMVLAEIALAALSGGASVALRVAGKAGKLARLAARLSKLDVVTDFAKGVDKAGDATDAGRKARKLLKEKSPHQAGGAPHVDAPETTGAGKPAGAEPAQRGSNKAHGDEGGLEFVPSKHADAGLRKLAETNGDWSKLTGKQARAVGVFLHKVMEGLVGRLASAGWERVGREAITAAKVAEWRKAGKRLVLLESHIPKSGRPRRLDLAEIDFSKGKVSLIDYVPTSDAAHLAKTRAYGDELAKLTGLPTSAVDVEYVRAGQLVDELPLP